MNACGFAASAALYEFDIRQVRWLTFLWYRFAQIGQPQYRQPSIVPRRRVAFNISHVLYTTPSNAVRDLVSFRVSENEFIFILIHTHIYIHI
jgi:hypothetical protein